MIHRDDHDGKRLHVSRSKIERLTVHPGRLSRDYKPRKCFWYARGFDWIDWCVRENFNLESLRHVYEVVLSEDHRILRIDSFEEAVEFTREFRSEVTFNLTKRGGVDTRRDDYIDWPSVAMRHDGIEIWRNPTPWGLKIPWTYGWDVASGAVWDLDAIERLVYLGEL